MISPAIKKSTASFLIFLLYTIPIAWFFLFIYHNSLNIPHYDDYIAILQFLIAFVKSDSFLDRLHLIFLEHNNHRIVVCRIATLLVYYISGSINFKILCIIGNVSLIGIVYIFYKSFKIERLKHLLYVPSVFIVFQIQFWQASLSSTAALQHVWILFFALACFYLLTHESRGYCIASFFAAVCATFSGANGCVCFMIGLAMLLIRKRFVKSVLWSCSAAFVLYIYFYDYQFNSIQLPALDEAAVFIFSFLGSAISFNHPYLALLAGFIVIIHFFYLTYSSYYKNNPALYAMIVFVIITAVMICIGRSHLTTSSQALAGRFNLNSSLLILCIYLSSIELIAGSRRLSAIWQNKKIIICFSLTCIVLSCCFCVMSYVKNLGHIAQRNRMLVAAVCIWQEKNNGYYLGYPSVLAFNNRFFFKIFTESSQIHAYELPANPHNDGDGIPHQDDNCPDTYNPFQEDTDGDGRGDACDRCEGNGNNDTDGDGIYDTQDNCCFVPNPHQEDADGNGIGDGCDAAFIEKHWIEAEQAVSLISPLEAAIDERASGKRYISSPDGSGNQYTPGPVMATYKVHIVKAGEYVLWGRVIAYDRGSDSFFVQMDDGVDNLWTVTLGSNWHWDTVNDRGNADTVVYTLGRGEHTIRLKLREDGTKLDKLLLTNGMFTFTPQGKGETAEKQGPPTDSP
jgi:hypothetical protein